MGKEARLKARELRAAQVAAERVRRKRLRIVGAIGGLAIVGLLAGILVVVINSVSKDDDSASGELVTPANLSASGAIPVGQAAAPVTVEIYQDYICPACGKFEQANSAELERLVQAGTVRLELHPLAFLDETSSGTKYSTRAANAIATVADRAPDKVSAFNKALYDEQPAEGSRGLTDDKIAELAVKAGVPQEVADAFEDRTFERWVAETTDTAFKSGIQGTPTVKINGKKFEGDVYTPGPLTQAIEAAGGTE